MVINNVCNFGFGGDLSSSLGHTCTITMFKYTRWLIDPFAPGDFAEKHVLKLVEWFSGHCRAIKS